MHPHESLRGETEAPPPEARAAEPATEEPGMETGTSRGIVLPDAVRAAARGVFFETRALDT
ncbi:MAG: hypothetical protein HY721_11505 [Planctomycetes bacterium]|nr:hypothetical protein [Planctomycetota bacterium]